MDFSETIDFGGVTARYVKLDILSNYNGRDFTDPLGDDGLQNLVGLSEVQFFAAVALAGDYNNSGTVDAADYTVWRTNFGSTSNLDADGNGNGAVDAADYVVWRNNLQAGGNAASTGVPEPTSSLLVVIAVTALACVRRFSLVGYHSTSCVR
jgi:hypothetical protein